MPGKPPLLCLAIRVITEASLLLQMGNERPYLLNTYLGNIGAKSHGIQKIIKVFHAINNNGYRIFAFTFSLGAKRVAWHET